jgi:hypothetical protein
MADYSKFRELVSHRIAIEYDTGARIVGVLAECRPSNGPVQFAKVADAKMQDSDGNVLSEMPSDLWICPNVLTRFALEEGASGRRTGEG